MKKDPSSKTVHTAQEGGAASTTTETGALVVVLRLRVDEDGDAMERVRPLAERSGELAATVILRAIGLGIAGNARSGLGELVWCDGLPGMIEALPERRTYRVTLDPKWAALAARDGAHLSLSEPTEKPITAADTMCSALADGIFDLERHWFGTFNSWESELADLIEPRLRDAARAERRNRGQVIELFPRGR